MKPRMYISAPIAGTKDRNIGMFRRGLAEASARGFIGVSPLDISPRKHKECPSGFRIEGDEHSVSCYMRADLQVLLDCDAIMMMPGWQGSWGCRKEFDTAACCGLQLWTIDRWGRVHRMEAIP